MMLDYQELTAEELTRRMQDDYGVTYPLYISPSGSVFPILPAYIVPDGEYKDMLRVWCDGCHRWHYHGQHAGHRVAHCDDAHPGIYQRTGYVLEVVGEWSEQVRDAKIAEDQHKKNVLRAQAHEAKRQERMARRQRQEDRKQQLVQAAQHRLASPLPPNVLPLRRE